ncbi:signal protein PDZ [Kibdelosporangium aridum]|uniref:Signal protein PDZ n=1 Tax=Kibdelosporangium aridum TaxID=2030 RepID=A0A428ZHP7_KIBAR|nr:trypsin-like peptidase domain-containing protein [Kibdelosporangium aridum]RSM87613.1 signal protein PDZ [Kibdelosporangium aridum]
MSAAVIVLSACTSGEAPQPPRQPVATTPDAAGADTGYADLVDRIGPSVVTVQVDQGVGSGVVLRPDVVVTNHHVVGQRREVTIAYADGSQSAGTVLATDTVTDLAVVRTERKNLPVPEFRTQLPRPGERALAIGSPLGFQNSVTAGIISGLHREIPGSAGQTQSLVDLIQTDASISPGNSGGALLDVAGRVVGINEAYIPPTAGAVSLGFAIPSATVLDVAEQLLADGTARHPYLGVSLGRLTPDIQQRLGVRTDHGALVLGVDQAGPAAGSGLRAGDVLVTFGGKDIRTVEDLLAELRRTEPGHRVAMTVVRGDARQQVEVSVGSRTG